jgi:hypothetical protein
MKIVASVGFPRVVCAAAALMAAPAFAGSHLWRFSEMFTNAAGNIQYIELKECCGSNIETAIGGKWVNSAANNATFTFPNSIPTGTANKFLLLGTAGFAALPGAPTPDFIIPANFLPTSGSNTLTYWLYGDATLAYAAGMLPTDGVNSLSATGSTAINSPTNYAGQSGSVNAGPATPAISDWGVVTLTLLILIAATMVLLRRQNDLTVLRR